MSVQIHSDRLVTIQRHLAYICGFIIGSKDNCIAVCRRIDGREQRGIRCFCSVTLFNVSRSSLIAHAFICRLNSTAGFSHGDPDFNCSRLLEGDKPVFVDRSDRIVRRRGVGCIRICNGPSNNDSGIRFVICMVTGLTNSLDSWNCCLRSCRGRGFFILNIINIGDRPSVKILNSRKRLGAINNYTVFVLIAFRELITYRRINGNREAGFFDLQRLVGTKHIGLGDIGQKRNDLSVGSRCGFGKALILHRSDLGDIRAFFDAIGAVAVIGGDKSSRAQILGNRVRENAAGNKAGFGRIALAIGIACHRLGICARKHTAGDAGHWGAAWISAGIDHNGVAGGIGAVAVKAVLRGRAGAGDRTAGNSQRAGFLVDRSRTGDRAAVYS